MHCIILDTKACYEIPFLERELTFSEGLEYTEESRAQCFPRLEDKSWDTGAEWCQIQILPLLPAETTWIN